MTKLRALLATPENKLEYGIAKLTIDRLVDPTADFEWTAKQLDAWTSTASALTAFGYGTRASTEERVNALRAGLYQPGKWNEHRPFRYDLENDPSGTKILANTLLPIYLRKRLGNCVSMPALFLVLAQRLGIDAYLSTAPEHTFVKVRSEDGTYTNHECTHDGGLKADTSYIREFGITKDAQANGMYLQPLSKKQAVLVMAGTLGSHYYQTQNVVGLHALADLTLEVEPQGIEGIRRKIAAHGLELNTRYRSKYKRFEDLPPSDVEGAKRLVHAIRRLEEHATALGWRPPSESFEENYRRLVGRAKS